MFEQHTVYKIRKIGTQTYSTGGINPSFTRRGKSWTIGDLRKHLNLLSQNTLEVYSNECEVVPFVESNSTMSIKDI